MPMLQPADSQDPFGVPQGGSYPLASDGGGAVPMQPTSVMNDFAPPAVPIAPVPAAAVQLPVNPYQVPAASDTTPAVIPEEVDDDGLDDPWIAKAREIVAQTHDDPYRQSRALSKLRADFLKARYNKDIKLEDSAA